MWPSVMNAAALGTTKNATRRIAAERRAWSAAVTSWPRPVSVAIAGSSAAAMESPKRLTGREYRSCALASAATAPTGSRLAIIESMNALSWATPRLNRAGPKVRPTSCTCRSPRASESFTPPRSRSAMGSWTRNWSRLPTTEAIAASTVRRAAVTVGPATSTVTMIATFHATGAA